MAKQKKMLSIDEELLREAESYCDENYLNFSYFVAGLLRQKLNEQKMIDSMRDVALAVKVASEKGEMDDETEDKLNSFMALVRVLGMDGK